MPTQPDKQSTAQLKKHCVPNNLLILVAIQIFRFRPFRDDEFPYTLWYPDLAKQGVGITDIILPNEVRGQVAQLQSILHAAEGDGDGVLSNLSLLRLRFDFKQETVPDALMMTICTPKMQRAEYYRIAHFYFTLIYSLVTDFLEESHPERLWDIRAQCCNFFVDATGRLILIKTPFSTDPPVLLG